ncbi:MAG: heme exporter protein CcmD [Sulfuricella sp.]|nr:heme exporter protein CcmD [Sulfuricella sp.]
MNWNSLTDFLHMGGYALYVWGSFGVTAALVAGEVWMLGLHRKQALAQARRAVEFGKVRDEDEDAA